MIMENAQDNVSRLDYAFAGFLAALSPLDSSKKDLLKKQLINLSQQLNQGHICVLIDEAEQELLLSSGLAGAGSSLPGEVLPLIIEDKRLYFHRYWHYEDSLAKRIKALSESHSPNPNLDPLLGNYFKEADSAIDSQKEAVKKAVEQGLCIITGGPGTGKTTTVCIILAVLQELAAEALTMAVAAPTGKAAMRLQEAIIFNLGRLNCPEHIKNRIPRVAATLHRLLGAQPPSPYFRHHADNPLTYDAVIVDEASMVDLALMSKLVDALKPGARLILLGDKDQLTSVESGSVLADLIAALPGNTVELTHSYRFEAAIKHLADAVNRQEPQSAWELICAQNESIGLLAREELIAYAAEKRREYAGLVKRTPNINAIFEAFNSFQILCANRYGGNGALAINQAMERKLFNQNSANQSSNWYAGRPVMILQNNPGLGLFNGDIGICLFDQELDNNLMVYFQHPDGSVRKYLPSRLPSCETVFALTIHKSQGSEFEEIVIVLPEKINPVLSKELLYTAITRAKRLVKIVAEKEIFTAAVSQKSVRNTGLAIKIINKVE